jgi:hypothetical protein
MILSENRMPLFGIVLAAMRRRLKGWRPNTRAVVLQDQQRLPDIRQAGAQTARS